MPKFNLLENLMTDAELAEALGKCVRTIQRWRRLGNGPTTTMIGGQPTTTVDDAKDWLGDQRKVPKSAARRRR